MPSFPKKIFFVLFFIQLSFIVTAQRRIEKLGRGVIATRTATAKVLVSWRLLATEPQDIGFNIYRSANGATPIKLNTAILYNGTNFEDITFNIAATNTYTVKAVVNNIEQVASAGYTLVANTAIQPFLKIPIFNRADYQVRYVFSGDLDGDGEFDFVIHKYPIVDATKPDIVEAYTSNGTLLWTYNGGPNSVDRDNIYPGSSALNCGHGDNITVYDINRDGKAEVILVTANGSILPSGATVVDANNNKQFLSVLNGTTGVEISRTLIDNPYLSLGSMNGHIGVAYLDGINPSIVWESAVRNSTTLVFYEIVTTWDWNGTTLQKKWVNDISGKSIPSGHQFKIFDIDGDGKDEIVPQAYALDDDGSLKYNLYNQAIDHGDRFAIGDLDPSHPGLELYGIQQGYSKFGIMWYYCNAKTGKVLLSQSNPANPDMGRGMAGDFDPRYNGFELYTFVEGLYNVSGIVTSNGVFSSYPNMRIWWDADLSSELLDNGKFVKWNYLTNSESRLYTISGAIQNGRTTPAFYGDILGDWREEAIYESADHNYLYIYTSPNFTTSRIYTLSQNPGYRNDMAVRGYYQSHNTDFYLGNDMQTPPVPPVQSANKYWIGTTNVWDNTSLNWNDGNTLNTYTNADTVMFDIRGNNADTIKLNSNISPTKIWMMNPDGKDYKLAGIGQITGTTEIVKSMEGTFLLAGNHSYTGTTTISQGQLNIDGTIQSAVKVKGLGAIGGRGTIAAGLIMDKGVNIKGGKISPGFGSATQNLATLTIQGNLLINGDNNFEFDVVPTSTQKNDSLIITGDLTINGTNKLIVNFAANNFVVGTYTLIKCLGTLTASINNFVLQEVAGVSKQLIVQNNEVKLIINPARSPQNITWNGSINNSWNFDYQNFLAGSNSTTFVSGDTLTFNSSALLKTVQLDETVLPSSINIITDSNYTIQGNGSIAGTTGITKNGIGNLNLLLTTNAYTGKTILNGGKVAIAKIGLRNEPSSLGAADSAATNIQLNNTNLFINERSITDRSLTINGADTITVSDANKYAIFNGNITGTGSLLKDGIGSIYMVGAKNFSGNVLIKAGSINLRTKDGNIGGLGTSNNITIEDATLYMEDVRDYAQVYWNINVPTSKTANLYTDGRCTLLGTLTGSGILNVNIPYVRTDFKGNWSSFAGKINIPQNDFRIANTNGYANASINLTGGKMYSISGASSTISIGELTGIAGTTVGSDNSTAIWSIGAKNTDAIFAGAITKSALTKVGTGTFTLTGNNTYTGTTTVSAGKLLVNNLSSTIGTGTGTLTVANGAIVGGTGFIKGAITLNSGSKIQPGSSAIGTLTDSTSVTFLSGAIAEMEIDKSITKNDTLNVIGSITFNGILVVNKLDNIAYAAGDNYKLFKANTYSGNFTSIQPVVPATGLAWSFNATTGVLSVVLALPVQFLSFSAENFNGKILLNWQTAQEINNDYFVVERSDDGVQFGSINTVKSIYASQAQQQYNLVDNAPQKKMYYYRIKQVDFDGKFSYSTIAKVDLSKQNKDDIVVYPNPTKQFIQLMMPNANNNLVVQIVGLDGKIVNTMSGSLSTINKSLKQQSSKLASGTFILKVIADKSISTTQFIKN